tara:strand:+ start:2604 stop:2780 length:177 start_codon:yes stop_codon:yes gene_type:complete
MVEYKFQKAVSLIGLAITIVGIAFKINELMFAHEIVNVGIVVLVVGLLWWGGKLIKSS